MPATHRKPNALSLRPCSPTGNQIGAENIFRRLHSKFLSITPLYVQRQDHARGLIHLLTLAARVLALGDYVARQALAAQKSALAGVYTGNAKRSTARPTMERMLKAYSGIPLLPSYLRVSKSSLS